MKKQFNVPLLAPVLLLVLLLPLQACTRQASPDSGPVVKPSDLARLSATTWDGKLGYLDYSSNEWVTIPVSMRFETAESSSIRYQVKYPGEPQYNESQRLAASADGRSLDGAEIIDRQDDGAALVLVTDTPGVDDGRSATIRTTYRFTDGAFAIEKSVRLDGQDEFFRRNAYQLLRIAQRGDD